MTEDAPSRPALQSEASRPLHGDAMPRPPTAPRVLQPAGWVKPKGYSNGMEARGRLVFVGGQVGWTGQGVFEARDLPGQVRQTLQNIVDVLAEAGARPEHVTSMTWYLLDKRDYLARQKEVGAAYRDVMGRHFPPMAVVQVSGLIEDAALVEIQATAVVPD
jgi:enamine deaminase RidA (YjgF/YER057c/UK114 family)